MNALGMADVYLIDLNSAMARQSGVANALRTSVFGRAFFEWYFTATQIIADLCEWHPNARLMANAVDVVSHRIQPKVRIPQSARIYGAEYPSLAGNIFGFRLGLHDPYLHRQLYP